MPQTATRSTDRMADIKAKMNQATSEANTARRIASAAPAKTASAVPAKTTSAAPAKTASAAPAKRAASAAPAPATMMRCKRRTRPLWRRKCARP